IRDLIVTGVQTCALPICTTSGRLADVKVGFDNRVYVLDSKEKSVSVYSDGKGIARLRLDEPPASISLPLDMAVDELGDLYLCDRSEERRVGKECRSRGSA